MKYRLPNFIILESESNDWLNAKKEWFLDYSEMSKDFLHCLCGHLIKEIIHIENKLNNKRMMIGNCCEKVLFGKNSQSIIFQALRKNKVNEALLTMAYKKGIINEWEYNFGIDVWRKKYFSEKTINKWDQIKKKIFVHFKKEVINGNQRYN